MCPFLSVGDAGAAMATREVVIAKGKTAAKCNGGEKVVASTAVAVPIPVMVVVVGAGGGGGASN